MTRSVLSVRSVLTCLTASPHSSYVEDDKAGSYTNNAVSARFRVMLLF